MLVNLTIIDIRCLKIKPASLKANCHIVIITSNFILKNYQTAVALDYTRWIRRIYYLYV